ncbi:MAG: hypothetical protein HYS55_02020 [Candidatus Omnitrophica bacterium]|nr:hypothetical protein [Candidatus Omnitrophota bacterium]
MRKFKKLSILVLILPLVIGGIVVASCFCPMAQAAVNQVSIQQGHHCCPNSHMNNSLEVGTVLASNKNINESQGCCPDAIQLSASPRLQMDVIARTAGRMDRTKQSMGLFRSLRSLTITTMGFHPVVFGAILLDFFSDNVPLYLSNRALRL